MNANLRDQTTRSRLVQIGLECSKVHNNITRPLELARDILLLRYRRSLAIYRSKEDKLRVVNHHFRDVMEYLGQIELVQEHLEMVIGDIDQSAYTINRMVEMLKMLTQRREYNV